MPYRVVVVVRAQELPGTLPETASLYSPWITLSGWGGKAREGFARGPDYSGRWILMRPAATFVTGNFVELWLGEVRGLYSRLRVWDPWVPVASPHLGNRSLQLAASATMAEALVYVAPPSLGNRSLQHRLLN